MNFSSLISGEVRSGSKIFKLGCTDNGSSNCAVAVGTIGKGENPLPSVVEGIQINEDVSSLIFLHASALPSENQKAYFNIPDFFDSADLLGWYEIVYEDGFRSIIPVQYGVNILEWNPGGEDRLDKMEGETGAAQNMYCYEADPVSCSANITANPITMFAYEWVNPRFGKIIIEVNLHGTNAIILAGISKVKKREIIRPVK